MEGMSDGNLTKRIYSMEMVDEANKKIRPEGVKELVKNGA